MTGFYIVLLFLLTGIFIAGMSLAVSRILQTRKAYPEKYISYECGELPAGESWIQFNNRFYIIALIFIIFDVEVLFMFPWAVVFDEYGLLAFVEMLIFIVILLVGLAYVWAKGDLNWIKPRPQLAHLPKEKGE
ncbi:NAD(P)H-quinone oxidoreductase subunit 3 [bacterium BMS3Abin05]|nr:NAD(P)H-quinone oxidoreductase subunit 3 [bacterium BMS3Abin05]GBE27201.1 NAD(P)H-quinone oxidoreductase subunit 3 [bacterium BMS3Bbin03]HDL78580.1 NADH-quinone oxidoreductase subunit A [Bacteroidota bacterium]HDZ11648.1 NADH-quinone oxidoreductase subunit A [Bacteroidota bacterium]